ncbi:hypothetical protein [Staphylococcus phage LY01]|nr:hypothetical protein [Staphylococcus phage LY01]
MINIGKQTIPFLYKGNNLLYPSITKENLVLYLDFKQLTGKRINNRQMKDLTLNNNITFNNFPIYPNNLIMDSIKLDGIDDYILSDAKVGGKSFTLLQSLEIVSDKEQQFFHCFNNPSFYMRKYRNLLQCSVNYGTQTLITANDIFLEFPKKIFIGYSFDYEKKEIKLIINGNIVDSRIITITSNVDLTLTNIGQYYTPSKTYNFDGNLCSISLYDRALTNEEIMKNYLVDKERWGV